MVDQMTPFNMADSILRTFTATVPVRTLRYRYLSCCMGRSVISSQTQVTKKGTLKCRASTNLQYQWISRILLLSIKYFNTLKGVI